MNSKTIEIRDRGTFIAAIATQLEPSNEKDRYLLARSGFGRMAGEQKAYILLARFSDSRCNYDPYEWGGRTMPVAHEYLIGNWESVKSGDVLDVEHILGESPEPKRSESGF